MTSSLQAFGQWAIQHVLGCLTDIESWSTPRPTDGDVGT